MLNENTRAWTNTEEGKKLQCELFSFMYQHRLNEKKYGDSMYEWMSLGWLKAKTGNHENTLLALFRLEEHGYIIITTQIRRDIHIKLKKKGIEKWGKKHA